MINKVNLFFKIETENDIDFELVKEELDIKKNLKIYRKGELKNPLNIKSDAKWKTNKLVIKSDENLDFTKQLDFLIDILSYKKREIIKFPKDLLIYFSCAIYLYSQKEPTPYINFTKKYTDFVKDTIIEFEIYIYNCIGDDT